MLYSKWKTNKRALNPSLSHKWGKEILNKEKERGNCKPSRKPLNCLCDIFTLTRQMEKGLWASMKEAAADITATNLSPWKDTFVCGGGKNKQTKQNWSRLKRSNNQFTRQESLLYICPDKEKDKLIISNPVTYMGFWASIWKHCAHTGMYAHMHTHRTHPGHSGRDKSPQSFSGPIVISSVCPGFTKTVISRIPAEFRVLSSISLLHTRLKPYFPVPGLEFHCSISCGDHNWLCYSSPHPSKTNSA